MYKKCPTLSLSLNTNLFNYSFDFILIDATHQSAGRLGPPID